MTQAKAAAGRVYYPALDGLRFIAFALVYLFHRGIPQVTTGLDTLGRHLGYPPGRGTSSGGLGQTLVGNGWVGVQLFFILSGFLITTLLLREESRDGRIDLTAFWMRRILRIWPLYYAIVLITFFVLPGLDGEWGRESVRNLWRLHLVPFLAFGGNWSMGLLVANPVPYDAISVLWSVCVEEQFYLFCPLLIAFVPPARRIGIVIMLMGLGIAGRTITANALQQKWVNDLFFQYSTLTQLDTLLAGVLLALLRERWQVSVRTSVLHLVEIIAWAGSLALLLRPDLARGSVLSRTIGFIAIWLAGAAIVAGTASDRSWTRRVLSYSRFIWLGRISYGLYMYHEIAFWAQRRLFESIGWFPNQEALAPFASLALTVGLAAGSYYGFERWFLRRKARWSRVDSRPV